jgi:hypothetical protein
MRLAWLLALAACAIPPRDEVLPVELLANAAPSASRYALPANVRIEAGGAYCARSADQDATDAATAVVATELARYPAQAVTASDLRRVVLCGHFDGEHFQSAGLAYRESHQILLDVHTPNLRATFHHEMFHMLDRYDFDPEWEATNPHGVAYAPGQLERRAGFVSAYAATNPDEDKACTFEHVMTDSEHLCELARHDRTLRAKIELVWTRAARLAGSDDFMHALAPCVNWPVYIAPFTPME